MAHGQMAGGVLRLEVASGGVIGRRARHRSGARGGRREGFGYVGIVAVTSTATTSMAFAFAATEQARRAAPAQAPPPPRLRPDAQKRPLPTGLQLSECNVDGSDAVRVCAVKSLTHCRR
jgi:hypothetical protein